MLLLLERVPRGLRGELSRWMIEPRANVFVGNVSAMVRDRLWEMACQGSEGGSAFMLYTTNNEQGYTFRLCGEPSRYPEEFEGLVLVRVPARPKRNAGDGGEEGGDGREVGVAKEG